MPYCLVPTLPCAAHAALLQRLGNAQHFLMGFQLLQDTGRTKRCTDLLSLTSDVLQPPCYAISAYIQRSSLAVLDSWHACGSNCSLNAEHVAEHTMSCCRYHHVNGAIHIKGGKIKLRSRPWHFKLRPNVADHLVARYNAGIYLHMPGGLEEMPLPRPRNLRRLSSLATSVNDRSSKGGALDSLSSGRNLDSASPTAAAAAAALDADDSVPQVGGATPYGAYGNVYSSAVQEAHDVADALHLTRSSEDHQRSEGLFGSFRRSKRNPGAAESSSSGWTVWHMFGCVAMQKGVKDESSSSDEDESMRPVHSRHSRQSMPVVTAK